jgi:glutathionyl-hydroquinone reductase
LSNVAKRCERVTGGFAPTHAVEMHIFNAGQHTIEAVIDETRADFSQLDTSFKRSIAVFADRAHIEFPREGTRYELSLHDACPFKKPRLVTLFH